MTIALAVGAAPVVTIGDTGSYSVVITGVPAGSSLVVGLHWFGNAAFPTTPPTVTEDSITCTQFGTTFYDSSNVESIAFFRYVGKIPTSGNKTVHGAFNGGATSDIVIFFLSGAANDPLDGGAGFLHTTAAAANSAPLSITPSLDHSAAIAFAINGFGGNPSAQAGFTGLNAGTSPTIRNMNANDGLEYDLDLGAGTGGVAQSLFMTSASTGQATTAAIIVAPGTPPQAIAPGAGSAAATGAAPTVVPRNNTVVTPIVARRKVFLPARKIVRAA